MSEDILSPLHVVLVEPEIPPNTGNVARLCAATGTELHLVEPLGFSIDDKQLKRAGLDYWPHARVSVWPSFAAYAAGAGQGRRWVMTSSKSAGGSVPVHQFSFSPADSLIFGPETRGLPQDILALSPHRVRIPIRNVVRSLNLSTAAGIVVYAALARCGVLEAW